MKIKLKYKYDAKIEKKVFIIKIIFKNSNISISL